MSAFSTEATAQDVGEAPTVVLNANEVGRRAVAAAEKASRAPESVRLVCVSKTKPAEAIQQLYDAGYRHFGENYFQELVEKAALLPGDIQWHFIGHLQSSKAAKLVKEVPGLTAVETVDTAKLAGKLNNACAAAERGPLKVFLQVDSSGEDSKSGVQPGPELLELVAYITEQCPLLTISGLMTIGAPGDSSCFDRLVEARETVAAALQAHAGESAPALELSMGMSGDFEAAIERGATSVRVGSTIFGARLYPNKA
jgi:pyridoxal phosphate enzyme (YggS family)